jgi:hypothetical protein
MPIINDPAVTAEIAALHDAYERAIISNDVDALVDFFWSSPHVARFGVAEHLYGADAINAYRQNHRPAFTDRKMLRRVIVTLGIETASVMCEFSQTVSGASRHTRQSQVWVRFPEVGWKIIAAHVSNAIGPAPAGWENYADQAAAAVGLTLDATHRPGVVANLKRAEAIARPLLDFPLPAVAEPASVFTA